MNTICEEIIRIELTPTLFAKAVLGYRDNTCSDTIYFIFPPHPVLGGDMENNVVNALFSGFAGQDKLVVKFNYRGVDAGTVENEHMISYWERLENDKDYSIIVRDTVHVIRKVRESVNASAQMYFVAYSFGALIALNVMDSFPDVRCVGISPPTNAYNFEELFAAKKNVSIIISDNDIFCDPATMQTFAKRHRFNLTNLPAHDHFYRGCEEALCASVYRQCAL